MKYQSDFGIFLELKRAKCEWNFGTDKRHNFNKIKTTSKFPTSVKYIIIGSYFRLGQSDHNKIKVLVWSHEVSFFKWHFQTNCSRSPREFRDVRLLSRKAESDATQTSKSGKSKNNKHLNWLIVTKLLSSKLLFYIWCIKFICLLLSFS